VAAAAAAVEWSSVQFQWSGQCVRLCFVLILASRLVFDAFPFPSSSYRVQVPCLPWLLLVGTACLSMLGCSACQPVFSWPHALYMLLVVSLTLCVAGLLLL
jgi:hypothetical protein